jgi:hypothetical protein
MAYRGASDKGTTFERSVMRRLARIFILKVCPCTLFANETFR